MKRIIAAPGINLKQLSKELHISMSTLSPHISKLQDCGLIRLEDAPASHGTQKLCYLAMEQIYIDFEAKCNLSPVMQFEVPIGQYSDFQVAPTCGLATTTAFLGNLDEPRSFSHPERYRAEILWFTTGYVEYILPNFIPPHCLIQQLTVTFELSSEAPKYNNSWPSDISFLLNGTPLGQWTSPGDFGGRPGVMNPHWWYDFLNQYGLLKKLVINESGSFLDEEKLSDVTVRDLNLNSQSVLKLRFQVFPDSLNPNGLTLYGKGFGNYQQNLRVAIQYTPENRTPSA